MRDIKQLHPDLQAAITRFTAAAKAKGYIIGIGECLRTVAEQNALYAKGRTTAGSVVTNARGLAYESQHQWGIAFDIYRNDGKGTFNDSDNWFRNVAQIAKQCGLSWGGDWTSIKDKPHFYLAKYSPDGTTTWLKRTYGTPERFFVTWKGVHNMGLAIDYTNPVYEVPRGSYRTVKIFGANANMAKVNAGDGEIAVVVKVAKAENDLRAAIVPTGKRGETTYFYLNDKAMFSIAIV